MRFMPDSLIERNAAQYEKKAAAEDDRRKKAALDRTADMKRVLALQLQEREEKRRAAVEERIMMRKLNAKELAAYEAEQAAKREAERVKKLTIKGEHDGPRVLGRAVAWLHVLGWQLRAHCCSLPSFLFVVICKHAVALFARRLAREPDALKCGPGEELVDDRDGAENQPRSAG